MNTVTFSAKDFFGALLKALGYFGLMLAGGAVAVIILMIFKVESIQINAAFSAALSVTALCLYLKRKGRGIQESLFLNKLDALTAAKIAGLSLAVTVAVQTVQLILPESVVGAFYNPLSGELLIDIVSLVILSPISEELFFRAVWIPTLTKGMPQMLAVAVSSIAFSVMHGNPTQMILAFLISIFYSAVFLRTQSALACILAHSVSNLAAVIFHVFGGGHGLF